MSAALGVLAIAISYSAGRHGYSISRLADFCYWGGQALILVPTSARLLSRKTAAKGTIAAIVAILAVTEYLVTVFYSPLYFSFSDELSHWQTAEHILLTDKLFTANYVLPISAQYPGLEEVTTALVQITGLSLFDAGLIVAGIAHLLFVATLYLLFCNIGRSYRLAGIAIFIYSTNPNLEYFDSIFAYQTLGIAFMGVALLAAWRLVERRSPDDRTGWAIVAVVAIAAMVITHHVTSYIFILTMILAMMTSLFAKDRWSAVATGRLALAAFLMVVAWIALAAPQTVSYLWPEVTGIVQSFHALLGGGSSSSSTLATPAPKPYSHAIVAGVATLLLCCVLPVGLWQARKRFSRQSRQAWFLALAVASLSWYAILAIRFGASDGAELFGRASTFVYVPAAFIAAFAYTRFILDVSRWRASFFVGASLVGVLLLSVDGILSGWPPSWERLPGPYQVAGSERSVGPEEIAVANWTLSTLGPDNRFATDIGNAPTISSIGGQVVDLDDSFLYLSSAYTQSVKVEAQEHAIQYALVDLRMSRQLPASGKYFPLDPRANSYTRPLPHIYLTKFNSAPGVARMFDSGDIVIYDLSGGN
jgi:hypothetical protein